MTFINQDCAIAEHKLDVTVRVLVAINDIRLVVDYANPGYSTEFTKSMTLSMKHTHTHARTHAHTHTHTHAHTHTHTHTQN